MLKIHTVQGKRSLEVSNWKSETSQSQRMFTIRSVISHLGDNTDKFKFALPGSMGGVCAITQVDEHAAVGGGREKMGEMRWLLFLFYSIQFTYFQRS